MGVHVTAVPRLHAEVEPPGTPRELFGLANVVGGVERIDRAAGDVLHVDSRALPQLARDAGIEPPAGDGQIAERRGGVAQRRQQPGGGARGLGAWCGSLEQGDGAAGLCQLIRRRASDNSASDN